MKPLPSARSLLARAMVLVVIACTGIAHAAAPDYSGLDRQPVVTPPAAGTTRGLTRGTTRGPTRNYDGTRGMVTIEEADGSKQELPYVVLPILFKVDSDELLNKESAINLRLLAAKLKEPQFAAAHFAVEGHTSTEGAVDHNVDLSRRRAERIFALLTSKFAVEAGKLSPQAYGPQHPEVLPELTEQDRQRNRRVLVVRDK